MGKLYIIEGIDGSGKSTQVDLLHERFLAEGREVVRLKFPQYDNPSSTLVKMYLGGTFGTDPDAVNAFAASSFYAVDRYASYKMSWGRDYEAGKTLLSDRYVMSNLIHQGAKLAPEDRLSFFEWLYDFEFDRLGLPRPDGVFFLDVSPEVSSRRMTDRYGGDESKRDIHERDEAYLQKCYEAGLFACEHGYMTRVGCVREDGTMLERDEVCDRIYRMINGGN